MTKVFPISKFTVNGNSMVPALQPGQDVLSFNWAYLGKKPKVGDVVVVKVNGKDMVKRVDKVYDCSVILQGDNQEESTDSRDFGAVNMDQIVGKVVYKTVIPAKAGIQINNSDSELDSRSSSSSSLSDLGVEDLSLRAEGLRGNDKKGSGNDMIECPQCNSPVIGIYGRKDAICRNCGFKLACCGEP